MYGGKAMTETNYIDKESREPVLNVVDRVSEMLFGLFMALTFIGVVTVAGAGRDEVREMFVTALGCNLAWGLVDAVMYLVRSVQAADAEGGRRLVEDSLPQGVAGLVAQAELEAIRGRIAALHMPTRPRLNGDDLLAALAIFLIVVAATFPVVVPFLLIQDVGVALTVSRGISLLMLFFGGLALGRYAGYGSWKVGFMMAGLGTALVAAINALGG